MLAATLLYVPTSCRVTVPVHAAFSLQARYLAKLLEIRNADVVHKRLCRFVARGVEPCVAACKKLESHRVAQVSIRATSYIVGTKLCKRTHAEICARSSVRHNRSGRTCVTLDAAAIDSPVNTTATFGGADVSTSNQQALCQSNMLRPAPPRAVGMTVTSPMSLCCGQCTHSRAA